MMWMTDDLTPELDPPETRMVRRAREHSERLIRQMVVLVAVALFAMLVSVGASIAYMRHNASEADQRWCALMVGLDDRYQKLPSDADPEARKFAGQVHTLRTRLGCK
jgi:hypothetical protein